MIFLKQIIFVVLTGLCATASDTEFSVRLTEPRLKELNFEVPSEKQGVSVKIETDRLELATLRADDFDEYLQCFGNPDIYLPYGGCYMSNQVHRFMFDNKLKHASEGDPSGFFSIRRGADLAPDIIGFAALCYGGYENQSFRRNLQAEVAVALFPDFHDKGYGTEALGALISVFCNDLRDRSSEFAEKFRPDRLTSLWALVDTSNAKSKKLLYKLGFSCDYSSRDCGQVLYRKSLENKDLSYNLSCCKISTSDESIFPNSLSDGT